MHAPCGWHGGCLLRGRSDAYEYDRQPDVLEHEDQDRDPHLCDVRCPMLDLRLGVGGDRRAGFGTYAEDLEAVGKGFKTVLLTYLIAQLL